MKFHIITIFPKIFDSYFNESIIKLAQKRGIIKIKIHNLRQWTNDKHKTTDDAPYGGGAGMVMKVEPIYKALNALKLKAKNNLPMLTSADRQKKKLKVVLLSAKGKPWDQQLAKKYSKFNEIILICGRYEGVDERVTNFIDEEISMGNYVLTGGEIPAIVMVDSITRLLPGVLGNTQSCLDESHSLPGILEYSQYTRPEIFTARGKEYRVPKILLSGNHKKIIEWRKKHVKKIK